MSERQRRPGSGPLGQALGGAHTAPATWRPMADVYQASEGGWIVKFDLAGVAAEDIQIYANRRRLTVSGVRRDTVHAQSCSHFLMEISYNRFERTIELPCEFDASHLLVEYRNGMLLVRIQAEGSHRERE